MSDEFHLSVVATSRNDDHGGSLRSRMQHFVDGFVRQCIRHQLKAELILVEWNPPADRPPLRDALKFPAFKGPCEIRIITVPAAVHERLDHARALPLFQMIAKNVGIRRARGRFVLATNIDILFSDALVRCLRDELHSGVLYRADRYDIPPQLPITDDFDEILSYCRERSFRVHRRSCTFRREGKAWVKDTPMRNTAYHMSRIARSLFLAETWRHLGQRLRDRNARVRALAGKSGPVMAVLQALIGDVGKPLRVLFHQIVFLARFSVGTMRAIAALVGRKVQAIIYGTMPHTNACGDFTLLAHEDWCRLRAYPEWQIFSWHLDSVLLYQAKFSGIPEIDLPGRLAIYHIEHGAGSGYTPENASILFSRLDKVGIPYLSFRQFNDIVDGMKKNYRQGDKPVYNEDQWGLAQEVFPEHSA